MNVALAVMRVPRQWKVFQVVFTLPVLGCNCHAVEHVRVYNLN